MPEKTVQKEPGKKPAPSKKPKPQQEVVVQISLSELHPFPDHPFQVREDASMQETAESVKEYGVLVPALARPREDGGYELIAGHRRKHACELAGLATMPVIVRDIDRDAATIIMVDSNLQRENILPSERAKAYKMKMEAIKRQGARTDLTSPKISAKFRSDDEVGQDAGVSGDTIRNYIALTQLVPELQQMVFFKWAFKSAAAVLIVTNTWTIVMGVFDAAQSVVASASGLIIGDTSINISSVMVGIEDRLMEMELGPLFGLWFQSLFVGITMWALTICIFIITFGRMIEIYLVTSVAPIPMATMMGKEWGGMGQNYIRSLLALGFQAFLIIVCVAIYAVLVQNIALVDDIIYAIWTCMGYTVLLCFCLFKTSSLAKSVFNAH